MAMKKMKTTQTNKVILIKRSTAPADYIQESDEESCEWSNSDASDTENSDSSDSEDEESATERVPCRYYRRGHCRNGNDCPYWHGPRNPRDGSSSRLQTEEQAPQLTDGRCYQWQLKAGGVWRDIENDHVIEAQYSLPNTRSIKLYNTPYGAVSISFSKMRVFGKHLGVRRLEDGNTQWIWYCLLGRKWSKYENKDSQGRTSLVKNADIERKYRSNPSGSFTFNHNSKTLEIKFRDMQQVGRKRKRRVARRPVFRQNAAPLQSFSRLSLRTSPQWEFEGKGGQWHKFSYRRNTSSECSVSSDDIERTYQQNNTGSMRFTARGQQYKLDFAAMKQTCVGTSRSRNVRRVLV